tara:strand:+ start:7911 stop:8327 length:417 start_codon:yes stop_codon:yes gene_type:complete
MILSYVVDENIQHAPLNNPESGINFPDSPRYVCTTQLYKALGCWDGPFDIFYLDKHQEYIGVDKDGWDGVIHFKKEYIESLPFGMIRDEYGLWWYAQCHDDSLFIDGNWITGHRDKESIRGSDDYSVFYLHEGRFKYM